MNCGTCQKLLEPSYMSCPQCKRGGGYELIEESEKRDQIWKLAARFMNSEFRLDSLYAEPSLDAMIERHWWVGAEEGSVGDSGLLNVSKICTELGIQQLAGVLIERIYEGTERIGFPPIKELTLEDFTDPNRQQWTSKRISYVALIDADQPLLCV